jgi:hydroxymethylpyrimidine pyrophosphatase-like HAD family hydrolase
MDVLEFDFYDRLRKNYLEHQSLFVAYDYDNTVYDYHNLGINDDKIISLLRVCKSLGFTMILFTGNEGETLDIIKSDLKKREIPYYLIN